jgi:hypothetical protein
MCGLGLVVVSGRAARDAFDALLARGHAGRPAGDGLAASTGAFVARDLSATVGRALGTAVDLAARTAERAFACAETAVERGLHLVGLPSPDEVRQLRARVDALSARLEQLAAPAQEPSGLTSVVEEAAPQTASQGPDPGPGPRMDSGAAPADPPSAPPSTDATDSGSC